MCCGAQDSNCYCLVHCAKLCTPVAVQNHYCAAVYTNSCSESPLCLTGTGRPHASKSSNSSTGASGNVPTAAIKCNLHKGTLQIENALTVMHVPLSMWTRMCQVNSTLQ